MPTSSSEYSDQTLWSMDLEDAEFETYVDAFGIERYERLMDIEPSTCKGKGLSSAAHHKLELHTGNFLVKPKKDDDFGDVFDDDLNREFLNESLQNTNKRVSAVVSRNRSGLQPIQEIPDEKRNDVYDGYNVKDISKYRSKFIVPTNRSTYEERTSYDANTHSSIHAPSLLGRTRSTVKAGAYDASSSHKAGRRSFDQSALTTKVHMSSNDSLDASGVATSARKAVVDATKLASTVVPRVSLNVSLDPSRPTFLSKRSETNRPEAINKVGIIESENKSNQSSAIASLSSRPVSLLRPENAVQARRPQQTRTNRVDVCLNGTEILHLGRKDSTTNRESGREIDTIQSKRALNGAAHLTKDSLVRGDPTCTDNNARSFPVKSSLVVGTLDSQTMADPNPNSLGLQARKSDSQVHINDGRREVGVTRFVSDLFKSLFLNPSPHVQTPLANDDRESRPLTHTHEMERMAPLKTAGKLSNSDSVDLKEQQRNIRTQIDAMRLTGRNSKVSKEEMDSISTNGPTLSLTKSVEAPELRYARASAHRKDYSTVMPPLPTGQGRQSLPQDHLRRETGRETPTGPTYETHN